jgi:hypothetical protein
LIEDRVSTMEASTTTRIRDEFAAGSPYALVLHLRPDDCVVTSPGRAHPAVAAGGRSLARQSGRSHLKRVMLVARVTILGLASAFACGTVAPSSPGQRIGAAVPSDGASGPAFSIALSPSRLSDLRGIEIGMLRGTALGRFRDRAVDTDEAHPRVATGDIVFNGQVARLGLVFEADRLSVISVVLAGVPQSQAERRAVFDRNAALLRATYGPGQLDSESMVLQWYEGRDGVAFFWHGRAQAFELTFVRDTAM